MKSSVLLVVQAEPIDLLRASLGGKPRASAATPRRSSSFSKVLAENGLTVIQETAFTGSTFNSLLLSHKHLQELNALSHVTFRAEPCERCSRSAKLDVSDNQVQDLTPLLLATWEKSQWPTVVAADNPIDCSVQASNVRALRALANECGHLPLSGRCSSSSGRRATRID